jgi:CBS domain-containing protein
MIKVADLMETHPYTCRSDDTGGDVIRRLIDNQVGGLVVVDEGRKLYGYITDGDIVRYITKKTVKLHGWAEMMSVILNEEDIESLEQRTQELLSVKVADMANKKKIYVDKNQDIEDAAELLSANSIKKIAVVEKGKVVGVVTRSSIMRHLLRSMVHDK